MVRPPVSPVINPDSSGNLRVSIYIPGRYLGATSSSTNRKPQYLPLTVNSIGFTQTEAAGVAILGSTTVITIGSSSCVPSTGGQTCSTTLIGALGQDQWIVSSYASSNATGSVLSIATLTKTIVAGSANVSNLTLNPVLSTVALVPTSGSCQAVAACTGSVVLNAFDVTGAIIVGPGLFVNASGAATPITLTASSTLSIQTSGGASAHSSVSQTSVDDLGQYAYDGTASAGSKTITATASGVATATYTLTLATGTISAPSSVSIGNTNSSSTTIPVSENGFGGTFTKSDNCAGVATIGSASSTGPSATFLVTQLGGGTCSALITDNQGGSASVSIISTTYVVTIQ